LGGGGLLYLGGEEETGGYKGYPLQHHHTPQILHHLLLNMSGRCRYGLAMMVELFSAILSGADYAAKIPPWRQGRGR
jgi:LDH2 family malate/lactate/ureidoglycolate dehydrogenase